jgi:putative N6-adenine-specific DNA methylase
MKISLIATSTMGLESVLARELKNLGYEDLRVEDGRVRFQGRMADICNVNLWCRTAGRIYVEIGSFEATTFDSLFEQTKNLPWGDWIPQNGCFPVTKITAKKSTLFSKRDGQSIVKKAVVESLKKTYKTDMLPESGGTYAIRVQIDKDKVICSIDSSGEGLNKRGYRLGTNEAPLRETLAAGLIYLSRWNPDKDVFKDPMCGTGTLLIEAAMMAQNIAPGLNRDFASESWPIIGKQEWKNARLKAKTAIKKDVETPILGSDVNGKSLHFARQNIQKSGVSSINVQTLPLAELKTRHKLGKLVCNPPYGERLSDRDEVEDLYSDMGRIFSEEFTEWDYYILTAHPEFENCFGKKATRNRKLYNGGLKCWYYQYY